MVQEGILSTAFFVVVVVPQVSVRPISVTEGRHGAQVTVGRQEEKGPPQPTSLQASIMDGVRHKCLLGPY